MSASNTRFSETKCSVTACCSTIRSTVCSKSRRLRESRSRSCISFRSDTHSHHVPPPIGSYWSQFAFGFPRSPLLILCLESRQQTRLRSVPLHGPCRNGPPCRDDTCEPHARHPKGRQVLCGRAVSSSYRFGQRTDRTPRNQTCRNSRTCSSTRPRLVASRRSVSTHKVVIQND